MGREIFCILQLSVINNHAESAVFTNEPFSFSDNLFVLSTFDNIIKFCFLTVAFCRSKDRHRDNCNTIQ